MSLENHPKIDETGQKAIVSFLVLKKMKLKK